jgi:hypothetical protein
MTPQKNTQKKKPTGWLPFLVKKFQDEWSRADARIRMMLKDVKGGLPYVGVVPCYRIAVNCSISVLQLGD